VVKVEGKSPGEQIDPPSLRARRGSRKGGEKWRRKGVNVRGASKYISGKDPSWWLTADWIVGTKYSKQEKKKPE